MRKTNSLLRQKNSERDLLNEYDSDEDKSQLLQEYMKDQDKSLDSIARTDDSEASGKTFLSRKDCVAHLLMFALLVSVIMLFVKNYLLTTTRTYLSYSYFMAFGLPMVIVSVASAELLYEKYVHKFKNSHPALYSKFLAALVILTTSAVAFFVLVSLFMSEPTKLRLCGVLGMVPYYICWFILCGMYIFVSPGLTDPVNKIPFYQVFMGAVYLVFALIYPIYISIVLSNQDKEDEAADENEDEIIPEFHEIFVPDESLCVLLPFMILFGIHMCAIMPQFLCQCNRKLEMVILTLVVVSFMFENWRYESSDEKFMINSSELLDSTCSLLIQLSIWLGIYILNFWPWK